jgi:hypothetical protein
VILVPGPSEEIEVVHLIYKAFLDGKQESKIAGMLNEKGILTDLGRPWTRGAVHSVLTTEKYIGNNVYHRTSFKLKRKYVVNPPEKWIRADGVFKGIIEPEQFRRVQEIILARSRRLSDEEMLDKLRELVHQHGRISGIIIDEMEGYPSSSAYRNRFGSLVSAYRLIDYNPHIDYSFIEVNRRLRVEHARIVDSVIEQIRNLGGTISRDAKTDLLEMNGELRISIVICRHTETGSGASRWLIRLDAGLRPDITVAVRMDVVNEGVLDYYLLPGLDMTWENLKLAENNGIQLDAYRFDSLDYLVGMAERAKIKEVA